MQTFRGFQLQCKNIIRQLLNRYTILQITYIIHTFS